MKIVTIDINAKEWFDKVNGNSYFSSEVVINYGMNDREVINIPFQYGYGSHYQDVSFQALKEKYGIESKNQIWQYCRENNIILRTNIQTGCKKRDLLK